jgi:hypothetical protein
VIAKAPAAGRVKTRLCPPCAPEQAAALAAAALADTLCAVTATPAPRRVLILDGEPGAWLDPWRASIEVTAQRSGPFAARLAGAFADVGGPMLLIGMDTPQVSPALLTGALRALAAAGPDGAALGPAHDGGYWAIGLPAGAPDVFDGVPMSTSWTGRVQRERLRELGLRCRSLRPLRDVDTYADALAVARLAPRGAFAGALRAVETARTPSAA